MKIGEIDLWRGGDHTRPLPLDLGEWGVLEFVRPSTLRLRRAGMERAPELDADSLLSNAGWVHYAFEPGSGRLLLLNREGKHVFLLAAAAGRLEAVATLDRWRDPDERSYDPGGLYRVELMSVGEDVLVEYECGVVRIGLDGVVRWRHEHPCFSHLTGVEFGVVWYEGNGQDDLTRDDRWGYRLENGKRVVQVPA